jgi:hypothetical protein
VSGPSVPSHLPDGEPSDHRAAQAYAFVSDLGCLEGYGGAVVSPDQHGFTVYWCGTQPDEVRQMLAEAAEAGIPARLEAADFAHALLDRLAYETSLLRDPTLDREWPLSASPADDGSGLVVGTAPESRLHDLPSTEVAALLGVPVPVTVEVGGGTIGPDDWLSGS